MRKSVLAMLCVLAFGVSMFPMVSCEGDSNHKKVTEIKEEIFVQCSDTMHAHSVDLGLSVNWACCNVGAVAPESYGGYYCWGSLEEVAPDFDNWDYEDYAYPGVDISGTSYDVARMKWGGDWRMPTLAECQELIDSCVWSWVKLNGVIGQKVTGPNGNSIFLPAAGHRGSGNTMFSGSAGGYWSGTAGREEAIWVPAGYFGFVGHFEIWDLEESRPSCGFLNGCDANPVRPVKDK